MTALFIGERLAPALAIAIPSGMSRAEFIAPGRQRLAAHRRFALMLAIRRRTRWSLERTGRVLGRPNFSTVIYGVAKAKRLEAEDPEFAALVAQLEAVL